MPDLSHLWQRFLLASALIFGLLLGVAATVFGYSNTAPVTVGWSVFRLGDVPLWTVAIVPLVVILIAGTVYHWWNSFHHFTQHMRHRHRVRELEAEVSSLKSQLDHLLEMPDHSAGKLSGKTAVQESTVVEPIAEVPALPEPTISANGDDKTSRRQRKRVTVTTSTEPEPVAVATDGTATLDPQKEANSEG